MKPKINRELCVNCVHKTDELCETTITSRVDEWTEENGIEVVKEFTIVGCLKRSEV